MDLINLEPATFKGHTSFGMIIAADMEGRPVFLIPEEKLSAGTIIK